MENTLKKLLSNEKYLIDEGSNELKSLMSNPGCVETLCNILSTCQDLEIRQYAAVILKKQFSKQTVWEHINGDDRKRIKAGLLETLILEPEKIVKNSIAQLIGVLLKHELPANRWPELPHFLHESMTSPDVNSRELGFYTLSILLETSPDEFSSFAKNFTLLFRETLNKDEDKGGAVSFFLVVCMIHLAPTVKSNKELMNLHTELIPRVLEVIRALSVKRPDRALDAMEFFYEYSERDGLPMLTPCIKQIVAFFLELTEDPSKSEDIKMKALSFLSMVARSRVKLLQKNNLIPPILKTVFNILCCKPENDEEEEYFTSDPDEDTVLTCACELLDSIAISLDAKKLIGPLTEFVTAALSSNDPYQNKAGYLILGIVSQGCEGFIRHNCLDQMVNWVRIGVENPHPVIKASALYSLGQFAEYLQPEISVKASEVLPILIWQIQELNETGKSGTRMGNKVDRLFYAVERFADNLEEDLIPFIPDLMKAILPLFLAPYHPSIRKFAMSCTGTIASAVKSAVMPFFNDIMERLNSYLFNTAEGDDISLQVEALDTLAVLARSVGADNFGPLAIDCIQLGLRLMSSEDPDIKKSCYGVFSSVSAVLKEKMGEFLPSIIPLMVKSLQEDIGTSISKPIEDEIGFSFNDNDEEDIDSSEDFDVNSIENDFVEEKEEACFALSELATNTGDAFFPYLQTSFEEVFKLLSFPNSDIRRAALDAEFAFVIAFAKMIENKDNKGDLNMIQVAETLVAKAASLATTDDDRDVVVAALDGIQNLLKEVGTWLAPSNLIKDQVLNIVKEVLSFKTEVQGWGEESEAVSDNEILDSAAFIIPALAKTMTHTEFSLVFYNVLPLLDARLKSTDGGEDDQEDYDGKAYMIGVISECMAGLGPETGNYVDQLFPYLLNESRNEDADIRNNAVFAIGEMAYHGKDKLFPHYDKILNVLSFLLANEKKPKVIDNACGVIARLILVNPNGLPLAQLLPVFFGQLPLKEDFDEDKWVYRAVGHLFELGVEYAKPHIVNIFKAASVTLHSHALDDEGKDVIKSLLNLLVRAFPEECNTALSQLPPDVVSVIRT